jgi:hypothetical protein
LAGLTRVGIVATIARVIRHIRVADVIGGLAERVLPVFAGNESKRKGDQSQETGRGDQMHGVVKRGLRQIRQREYGFPQRFVQPEIPRLSGQATDASMGNLIFMRAAPARRAARITQSQGRFTSQISLDAITGEKP